MPESTIPYSPTSSDRSERSIPALPAPSLAPGGTLLPAGRFAAAPAPSPTFHVVRGGAQAAHVRRRATVELRAAAHDAEDTRDTNVLPASRRNATRASIVVTRRTGLPSDPPEPRGCA